jgi:hypothetical protein
MMRGVAAASRNLRCINSQWMLSDYGFFLSEEKPDVEDHDRCWTSPTHDLL